MLADELLQRDIGDDLMWFVQWECDDVIRNKDSLPRMWKISLNLVMMGVESPRDSALKGWKKGITPNKAKKALKLLK